MSPIRGQQYVTYGGTFICHLWGYVYMSLMGYIHMSLIGVRLYVTL